MHIHTEARGSAPSAKELLDQLDRILHSGPFGGSELLRNLLSFLVKRALDHPGEAVKEYDVAVEGLGRSDGFDPRMDSAVRVHAARLRSKLAEYYVSEGAGDRVLIDIPKGAYMVDWHYRNGQAPEAPAEVAAAAPMALATVPRSQAQPVRRWKWFLAGVAVAVFASGLSLVVWRAAQPTMLPPGVKAFWRPFRDSAQSTLVVFSNPRLVGSSATGLRSFRDGVDSPADINETYSGTGTVMSVFNVGRLFSIFGTPIRVKRAELLTWDEVQNANVVFIGGPESNTRLREFPTLHAFAFKSSQTEPRFGTGGIVNLHPRPGEEPIYFSSGRPYTSDYAVIAMLPGLKPQARVLMLAGTNTYGVQAATDFTTREDLVEELLSRLGAASGGPPPDFEALLEVKVSGGVPVQSKLVLVRSQSALTLTSVK